MQWRECLALDSMSSVRNADSYALLGYAEQLLRYRMKLDPDDPRSGKLELDAALEDTAPKRKRRVKRRATEQDEEEESTVLSKLGSADLLEWARSGLGFGEDREGDQVEQE